MNHILKGTVTAYMTPAYYGPIDLSKCDPLEALGSLTYAESDDMAAYGWTRVGTAHIELALVPQKELIENKVAALRGEMGKIRADSSRDLMKLEDKINNLLALPYDSDET